MFAKHGTTGDPFALIALTQVTGVCRRHSLSSARQHHVGAALQPQELHLHCVSTRKEARPGIYLCSGGPKRSQQTNSPMEQCVSGGGSTRPCQSADSLQLTPWRTCAAPQPTIQMCTSLGPTQALVKLRHVLWKWKKKCPCRQWEQHCAQTNPAASPPACSAAHSPISSGQWQTVSIWHGNR